MSINQRIKLNLIPGVVLPRINVVQFDKGSRWLFFEIWNGESRYLLNSGMSARIQGTKADRHCFDYAASIDTTNNVVAKNIEEQMTAAKGECLCEIVLTEGSTRIGTLNFILDVQPAALNEDSDTSRSDLPDIIAMATEQMYTAEAYAKGTRGGVPVTSGQVGYHDNSKYWNEQTQQYVSQAQTAATSASNSASSASNSATAAANSATAAAGSATSAATSANTATTKATTATEQALKAEGFAVGKQNGTDVGSGSPYYQNNAEYYAGEASDSATAAATSETNASTSATIATTKSQEAGNFAEDAEAWAVGKRNGNPVAASDETYDNNSKYYANQSAQEAAISKAWAVGPNGSGVGTDTNNSKYWSEISHFYSQSVEQYMNTMTAYIALIKMLFDTLYITTESGDRIITESGDYIIMDY
jgi:hypothetical protein